jgi:NADP-dependent 3-hydroxy acid dehydrogenase YdfG
MYFPALFVVAVASSVVGTSGAARPARQQRQIDIGNAATELTRAISQGALQADGSVRPEPVFDATHVAAAVLYMASLPLDANVQFMTITATTMPFIGRG